MRLVIILALTAVAYGQRISGSVSYRGSVSLTTVDADLTTYVTRVTAAGGSLTSQQRTAIATFISSAKLHGYWSHLLEVGPLAGDSLAAALVKLKAYSGAPTSLVNHSFVAGEYSASTGLQGNTSISHYLGTGITYDSLNKQQFGFAFWTPSVVQAVGGRTAMGVYGASPYSYWGPGEWGFTNGSSGAVYFSPPARAIGPGLYHGIKVSSTRTRLVTNGYTEIDSTTSATGTASKTAEITVFGGYAGASSVTYPWPNLLSYYAVDDGQMTDAQIAYYAADVQQLHIGLGRLSRTSTPLKFIPSTGQSLSIGWLASPALSITQPYGNLMLDGGAITPGATQGTLGPLYEVTYESHVSGMANEIAYLARQATPGDSSQDVVAGTFGAGGAPYSLIKKGTATYTKLITAAQRVQALYPLFSTASLVIPVVMNVHGEADAQSNTYQADIEQWQSDYETDLKAITGQAGTIPMFHSQVSSYPVPIKSSYAMLDAMKANPTKTLVVCPKYFMSYQSDYLHLDNAGFRLMGAYYGKAYYKHVVQGQQYWPLMPQTVSRTAGVITIQFKGAVGNLVWDTTAVTNPGNYGFEYADDLSSASIASVEITDAAAGVVTITLNTTPTGTNKRIRYAYTPPANCPNGTAGQYCAGPTTGARGNLRDSDTTVTPTGEHLYNWCVHFNEVVP